ncbi:hypothetical protein [Streptomyces sp. NPDC054940]
MSASNSAIPARNADDPGLVASSCTRKSSWNSGSTSSSRVAEVTLWTTRSTFRVRPRVAHRAESSPTGTRIHPAPATPSPASRTRSCDRATIVNGHFARTGRP